MHPHIHARSTPTKTAFVMAGSGASMTYRELEDASNRFAQLLRARGLKPGDHIAILLENHPRYFELCFGAHRAGIIYTAMSTRLTVGEAAYIVENCEARLIVTSRAMADLAAQLLPQTPGVTTRLMLDGAAPGHEPYEAAVAAMPAERISDETAGGDMLYSSGTTGRPKGVWAPPDAPQIDATGPLINVCQNLYRMGADTIYLSPAPLYHAAPLRWCLTTMRLGGTCVVMEHFDAEQYLHLIEKHRVTHTQLVPTMFVRMLKLPPEARRRHALSSLRVAIHAAAPCPIPVKREIIEWWGPVVWEYYAGTEGNGMTMVGAEEWMKRPGTVGRAVIGKLKVCDDDGAEVPAGTPGTIYFAEGRPFNYHNDPDKTASSTHRLGWTTLGDVGYVDGDGFLFLTDRKAHMIISGGVNVYPQEAENLLITHPAVLDCAVIGVPDDDLGEAVKAVVQPRDMSLVEGDKAGTLEAELIAFCRASLSPIKCPKSIDFAAELPRHPTGKLYKRLLRDRYWEGRANKLV
ncbi:MAG: AMP-binding protein [Burkholderiales bacterium]|nr:AMP-binding protein [Burkholderiales bacterium]